MNKFKYIIIYYLSIILISYLLSGCAPIPVLNKNESGFNLNGSKAGPANSKAGKMEKGLKERVAKILLGLNNVPNKKSRHKEFNPYINPLLFMSKTAPQVQKVKKLTGYKSYKIPINKTVKNSAGKFELKIKSIKIIGIFGIINFSIKNLSANGIKYNTALTYKFKKTGKIIPFKSDLNIKNYSSLNASTGISGSIAFLMPENLSGVRFKVFIKTGKNNKLHKLAYKF